MPSFPEGLFIFFVLVLALLLIYFFSGCKKPIEDSEKDFYPLDPGEQDFSPS